jgi:UDP-glucose-4-epimerase GalE
MAAGTVLVTGGAGYIGSHTVQALARSARSVVVLDSLEYGRAEAVGDVPLVVGDIADEAVVADICRDHGVTQVVHFAAYKAVGESMEQPTRYWQNNVANTVALIDAVTRAGADQFVFSSSCSVYGTPPTVPVDESAPIAPESVYAETKATVERILSWYAATDGLRSVSLRYFNAAGASFDRSIGEDWTVALNLVPLVMKSMILGEPRLTVYGTDYDTPDGTCIRDYIHVDDLAEAHVKALDVLGAGTLADRATALNVGTGTGSSVLEVIDAAERITGHQVPYELGPRRPGDPTATFADPSRARALLGWEPRYGLDEIIRTAYAWHSR